jgi:hypothetical protein
MKKILICALMFFGLCNIGYSQMGIDAVMKNSSGYVNETNPLRMLSTDRTFSETTVIGTGSKTTFPTKGSTAEGIKVYGIMLTCSNVVNSGSFKMTNSETETTKILLWQSAGLSDLPQLPSPIDFDESVSITVSTGITAHVWYLDY